MAQDPNATIASTSENLVKIKEEKIDPEIEKKIEALNTTTNLNDDDQQNKPEEVNHSSGSEDDDDDDSESSNEEAEDEKKNIEPVKSSNEILAELFKVFNAAPPEELLDDKNLIEKTMKRKKEKKKRHKKHRTNDEKAESESEIAGSTSKHKKKKKHKHKHKDGEKSKEKKKSKDKDKDKTNEKDKEKSRAKWNSSLDLSKHKEDASKHTSNGGDKHSSNRKDSSEHRQKHDSRSSSDHKRQHEKDCGDSSKRRKTDDKEKFQNSFYSSMRDRDGHRKDVGSDTKDKYRDTGKENEVKIKKEAVDRNSSRKMSDGDISEISLSDEEMYLERKDKESDYNKYKVHNSFYDGSNRSRSRETDRNYNKDRFRNQEGDRDREGYHHRNSRVGGRSYHSRRSKSRSRSCDLGIDKKRLLEIARKNAISMFKRGNLPGCDNMTEDIKDKVLLKMRYGGRTVEDLTEFCKKISNGEHLSDLSSDEGSDIDKGGNAKAFHHPFQLKEREPIVMHIRNSKPILPAAKTEEQTKNITMQFPVSSGQQHRMTEAWVPVERKEKLPPLPALPAAMQSTSIFKSALPKNALGKTLPTESEQEPAFKPVEDNSAATTMPSNETPAILSSSMDVPPPAAVPQIPPFPYIAPIPMGVPPPIPVGVPAPTLPIGIPPPPVPPVSNNFIPDVPVPSCRDSIFPEAPIHPLDVSSIISKRLNAMRRLQENPMDSEAIKMMYNSQKEMTTWAASKHLPGQFTGSTGVNVLKPNQLNSGPQIWARRDQLTSCKPVTGGMGMHLLQKMGWKPGEGLGRDKNGSLQPLLLDVKLDKRGLVAQEDIKPNKSKRGGGSAGGNGVPPPAHQNYQEKHPVCLLNEITTKYKWTPPLYNLIHENGPSHSRMFLFSVQVNNETHTPTKLCNTKKEAKFQAAKLCLQKLGILPPG